MKRGILNLKQGEDDLNAYYSKLQKANDEYHAVTFACAYKFDMNDILIQFLYGLNANYDMVRDHGSFAFHE